MSCKSKLVYEIIIKNERNRTQKRHECEKMNKFSLLMLCHFAVDNVARNIMINVCCGGFLENENLNIFDEIIMEDNLQEIIEDV